MRDWTRTPRHKRPGTEGCDVSISVESKRNSTHLPHFWWGRSSVPLKQRAKWLWVVSVSIPKSMLAFRLSQDKQEPVALLNLILPPIDFSSCGFPSLGISFPYNPALSYLGSLFCLLLLSTPPWPSLLPLPFSHCLTIS